MEFPRFDEEANVRRRVILVAILLVGLVPAGALGYRLLGAHLFESVPVYSQLPDFELVDASGRAFARERLRGKVWVADLIYTRCEDTCPLQTLEMRRLQKAFAGAANFGQISITTDPDHDTGTVLTAYARRFGADRSRWFFLTGSPQQIRNLALKGFRLSYATKQAMRPSEPVYKRFVDFLFPRAYAHHPGHEDGSTAPNAAEDKSKILISHSSRFVLIDGRFNVRGYYHSNDADSLKKLRKDLAKLLKG